MGMYSRDRWLLFVLFAPCVLMTSAVLLPWSLLGFLLFVPGVLGLSGIVGLLLGWIGFVAPRFAVRRRGMIGVLLVMGSCAAVLGMLLASGAHSPDHGWDLSYLVGLGGSSLSYAAIAGFFLAGLVRTRDLSDEAAPLGVWTCALSIVIAIGASIVPFGVLLFVAGAPMARAFVSP